MEIDLSENDLVYIMLWYAARTGLFRAPVHPEERDLASRIELMIGDIPAVSLVKIGVSGTPKYQPGEKHEQ